MWIEVIKFTYFFSFEIYVNNSQIVCKQFSHGKNVGKMDFKLILLKLST